MDYVASCQEVLRLGQPRAVGWFPGGLCIFLSEFVYRAHVTTGKETDTPWAYEMESSLSRLGCVCGLGLVVMHLNRAACEVFPGSLGP